MGRPVRKPIRPRTAPEATRQRGRPAPRSRFRAIALGLLLLSAATNLLAYGGLASLADIGPQVALSARRESMLATTYIWLGSRLVGVLHATEPARALADQAWAHRYASIRADPALAMERLLDPSGGGTAHAVLAFNHWATPVLLLVWAVLYALRERQVRTFG